jgi:hypothetical protein
MQLKKIELQGRFYGGYIIFGFQSWTPFLFSGKEQVKLSLVPLNQYKEVYRWFMEMFIDAYEWVMVPNVLE